MSFWDIFKTKETIFLSDEEKAEIERARNKAFVLRAKQLAEKEGRKEAERKFNTDREGFL